MCGIVGFIDFNKKSSKSTLQEMTDVLHHRGPDDSGYSFYDNLHANIGLGHKRLSILDLSKLGHQPMLFENLEIVYNGEVYNFKEIREELETHNYKFKSDSDTEVILKAYHKWGIKAVDKFNGMFAISIYDKRNQKVVLVRDRAGVKPLYWYWKDDLFMYASELKSFHKHDKFKKMINIDALALYFQYGYILQPHTIFQDTYKLKSGHYLEINIKSKLIREIKYWEVIDFYNKPKLKISKNEAVEQLNTLLKSSFEYRMVADVPVGVFLSGGYDSSSVSALLQSQRTEKLKTFTIGFYEQGFNEAQYAKKVANFLGTEHTEYYCTQQDALDIIPTLPEIFDEPFADSSAIPTILVSKLAKQKVTVALSADGGDEAFAGYNKYNRSLKYQKINNLNSILKTLLKHGLPLVAFSKILKDEQTKKIERIIATLGISESESILKVMVHWNEDYVNILLKRKPNQIVTYFDKNVEVYDKSELHKMLAIDYKTYMADDVLTKVDRATMSVSLEGREPLLDYRIIEFAAQLPANYKLNGANTKDILKHVVHKCLPETLVNRPKKGFGVPLKVWFKDKLEELVNCYLDESRLNKENIFNVNEVTKIKKKYQANPDDQNIASSIWSLIIFEMWYEKWM